MLAKAAGFNSGGIQKPNWTKTSQVPANTACYRYRGKFHRSFSTGIQTLNLSFTPVKFFSLNKNYS